MAAVPSVTPAMTEAVSGALFLLHPGGSLDAQRLGGHGKGELFQCPAGFKFLRVIGVQRAVQDGPAVKHHAGGHPVGVGYQPDGGVLFQRESGIASTPSTYTNAPETFSS